LGRQLRWAGRLTSLYFGGVAGSCLFPFAFPQLAAYPGGSRWAWAMLVGVVPAFAVATYFVVRHARRSATNERARCQLLLGAIALGVGSSALDLLLIADSIVLRFSALPLLASAGLIAGLVLKTPILERVTTLTMANVGVLALVALIAHVLMFRWVGS